MNKLIALLGFLIICSTGFTAENPVNRAARGSASIEEKLTHIISANPKIQKICGKLRGAECARLAWLEAEHSYTGERTQFDDLFEPTTDEEFLEAVFWRYSNYAKQCANLGENNLRNKCVDLIYLRMNR
jgi:hypothetical protein